MNVRPDCVCYSILLSYLNINIVHKGETGSLWLMNGVIKWFEAAHKYATSQVLSLASLSVERCSLNSRSDA